MNQMQCSSARRYTVLEGYKPLPVCVHVDAVGKPVEPVLVEPSRRIEWQLMGQEGRSVDSTGN
jgi:hypothetical protein